LRESIFSLFICLVLPSFLLRILLSNKFIEINGSIVDEGLTAGWLNGKLLRTAQSKSINCANGILFVSQGLKLRFHELYLDNFRSFVVENGAENITPDVFERTLKYAYVGANTRWQNIENLLGLINKFHKDSLTKPEVHLAGPHLGDIPFSNFKNLNIIFHGVVTSQEANQIYKSCSVLLCPDTRIYQDYLLSSPIKLYQGLKSGCVVVFLQKWDWNNVQPHQCCRLIFHVDELIHDKKKSAEFYNKIENIDMRKESSNYTRLWTNVVSDLLKYVKQ
jgi:hypothetical protein